MPLHATADQNNLFKSWQAPRLCGEAGRLEWKSISCVLYKTCTWGWPIYWYIIKISTWLHCNIQKAWWQSTVKLQVLNYKSSQAIKMMTNVTSWFSCFLVKLKIVMQKGSFQLIVNHIKDIITSKILAIDCPYHAASTWMQQYTQEDWTSCEWFYSMNKRSQVNWCCASDAMTLNYGIRHKGNDTACPIRT